jgi:hypothetical protein
MAARDAPGGSLTCPLHNFLNPSGTFAHQSCNIAMIRSEASSIGRVLGTSPASPTAAARAYRIRKSFAVVHFEPAGRGRIVFLPEGAELCIVGPSCLCECYEVLWESRFYNIFKADLLGPWANPVAHRVPGEPNPSGPTPC